MDYLTRAQWGATYDVSKRDLMTGLPVPTIFIHHTVTNPTDDAAADMRKVEAIDIARFGVPSYSWTVHPTGVVCEGMGNHRGAHTINNAGLSLNNVSFGISFVGNYELDDPTERAMTACRELIASIAANPTLLRPGFAIRGHRDVYATACPGAHLYPRLSELYPTTTEDEEMPKATFVKKADAGEVYLAGLTIPPRHVTSFKAAEYHAQREGLTLLDPPTDARELIEDGDKTSRWVMIVGDGTLWGI